MKHTIQHRLIDETKAWWREAFHTFSLNPKDRDAETQYQLARTTAQLTEVLEHLRHTLKKDRAQTAFWIEREMDLALKNLCPEGYDETRSRDDKIFTKRELVTQKQN